LARCFAYACTKSHPNRSKFGGDIAQINAHRFLLSPINFIINSTSQRPWEQKGPKNPCHTLIIGMSLYTVCPLFIPYYLENFLVQCYWIALCTIRALFILYCFFGEFLLPLYFRETLFLVYTHSLPLFTWAFCSFPSECLLCVSLVLSSLALLCHLPAQLGHLPSTSFVSMTYRKPY